MTIKMMPFFPKSRKNDSFFTDKNILNKAKKKKKDPKNITAPQREKH